MAEKSPKSFFKKMKHSFTFVTFCASKSFFFGAFYETETHKCILPPCRYQGTKFPPGHIRLQHSAWFGLSLFIELIEPHTYGDKPEKPIEPRCVASCVRTIKRVGITETPGQYLWCQRVCCPLTLLFDSPRVLMMRMCFM